MSTQRGSTTRPSKSVGAITNARKGEAVSMTKETYIVSKIPQKHHIRFPALLKRLTNAPSIGRMMEPQEIEAAIDAGCEQSRQLAIAAGGLTIKPTA